MELKDAEALANTMMTEHGLIAKGWHFAFDRAKKRLGACHYWTKKISISKYMAAYATEEQVRQTMLHEIAHALLPHSAGHKQAWKDMAKSIGYTGSRLAENPYITAQRLGMPGTAQLPTKAVKGSKKPTGGSVKVISVPVRSTTVQIGSKLRMTSGKIVTVTKQSSKRWRAVDTEGKVYAIAFEHAPMFLI